MRLLQAIGIAILLAALVACQAQRRKSDAELGLNPQQATGRHIFDAQCGRCHDPYSSSARKGPSLEKLYKRKYLPSGLPATDEHVTETIMMGRKMMPSFNQTINDQQLQDLLAYLHTL